MSIAYPLSVPSRPFERLVTIRLTDAIGLQSSPLTFGQTLFDWGADMLAADIEVIPMQRADAETFVAFLWSLRGRLGTFLMGDSANRSPRGTWAGTAVVNGAHAAGVRTVALKNLTAGATGKQGDWLQFGSGSTSELHKLLADFTADGGGLASAEIAPRTRRALSNNAAIVTSSPLGLWRLASNTREYSIGLARRYGLRLACVEALEI